MKVSVLLISGAQEDYWRQVVEDALASLGTLQFAEEQEALDLVLQQSYDMVIVDATAVVDASSLVSRIKARQPNTRIVVATTSPTWTRAREAFYAGATDYIRKSLDTEEILSALQAALTKPHRPG